MFKNRRKGRNLGKEDWQLLENGHFKNVQK